MSKFVTAGALDIHLDGGYVKKLNVYDVRIASTYSESRFPDEKHNMVKLVLTKEELASLIFGLTEMLSAE